MTPLTRDNQVVTGYTGKGLKTLTGSARVNPCLSFTRRQFVHDLPKEQKGMSISGYQPKLQMILSNREFAVIEHQGDYILKPSPDEFPYLAENEHATMTVMARLGFEVPPHGLLSFKPEQPDEKPEFAFVIRRFDRDVKTGAPIHQEQLDGGMGIREKYGKIKADGKQYVSYERIARFLIEQVNDNLKFMIDLFRRIVYAYLLGNNDMHLRNFALIHPSSGKPVLAPIYDFVSVAPYKAYFTSGFLALPLLVREEGEKALAPGFATRYGEYLGMDFLVFGRSMGLSEKLLRNLLLMALPKESGLVEATYRDSFMSADAIEATLQCYRQRLNRIQVLDAEPV
ncbi:type II toxin-antitoxin system HipA family toxin [Brenneria tiliae]|uniref:HipA domain-containing protein n=1 Tax=Brenneria tiliae TaxID=2914984 RepID=A0ABT0MRR2_9GAMM|nr:HipA domain-containing protein [Brenneria tiliae]MCL2891958.1 HipA domain-containing protein [Brenneria tiliae]